MLANLRALLGVIFDIVLLRRGPDSLPASSALLAILIVVYLVVSAISIATLPKPPAHWPLQLVIGTSLVLGIYHLAFLAAQKHERYVQTLAAVFAVGALFAPALIPLWSEVLAQSEHPETASGATVLLALIVSLWLFVVQIRMVRAALEWPVVGIILFLFAQEIAVGMIIRVLFGAAAAPV